MFKPTLYQFVIAVCISPIYNLYQMELYT